MSVPQESGTALASIIGARAEVLKEWKSFRVDPGSLLAQWHSKFWGKSMAHEKQKWRDTQSPMPVEGSELGGEDIDVDMTEGEDSDDDFIKGCYSLDIDFKYSETLRIWIRAEYEYTKPSISGATLLTLYASEVVHQLPSLRDNQESVSPDVPLSYGSS